MSRQTKTILAGFAALALATVSLELFTLILRLFPVLLLLAGVGVGGRWLWRRARRPNRPRASALVTCMHGVPFPCDLCHQGQADLHQLAAENASLRDQLDQARADLEDARMSAQVAWDAAATVAPRQVQVVRSDLHNRLLADPRSGVRPLFEGDRP